MDPIAFDVKDVEIFQYRPPISGVKSVMNGDVAARHKQDGGATSGGSGKQKTPRQKSVCCFCFKTTKLRRRQYIVSFFTNVGIFSLLLGYTFLGSFIFLAIEGGNNNQIIKPRMLPDKQYTDLSKNKLDKQFNDTAVKHDEVKGEVKTVFPVLDALSADKYYQNYSFLNDVNSAARARTVENIWEITVSLNILYRENWTRLAGQEISKFQDELVHRVAQEMAAQYGAAYQEMALGGAAHTLGADSGYSHEDGGDWCLAKAFFYSLTVLTTIGYGNIAPRTALGKAATIGYALLGIPLTMLYLTSVGSLLSRVARGAFSRALCCCLCSNCGYCCYDERRMAEKERRMKLKRQQEEQQNLQSGSSTSNQTLKTQEAFYVRSAEEQNKETQNENKSNLNLNKDLDNISWTDTESKLSMQGLSILAPILLCLCIMFFYIVIGTIVLYKLDNLRPIDGFYFCFMSLSTIGFGNLVPGTGHRNGTKQYSDTTTLWFCSIYILSGLALTAMCFNVVHDEIVHRLKHRQKQWSQKGNTVKDETNLRDPFYIAS